jgi:pimeloyl-ACP methyl ester carboxylesterase
MIGVAVAALGAALRLVARAPRRRALRGLGISVVATGAVLAVGGTRAWVTNQRTLAAHPMPGKLVDVGGFRMHLLAEGDSRGGPTFVWIPGAHAEGSVFLPFQRAVRDKARSIVFDRAGTGWSDPGPFPRRTSVEAEELARLLEGAGEQGPFILVGHSYGGLLAANYARRYKGRTAAVILVDATPPDAIIYAPVFGAPAMERLIRASHMAGLQKSFGLFSPGRFAADTLMAQMLKRERTLIGDGWPAIAAHMVRPASEWAAASLFEEVTARGVSAAAPDYVVYDGELNGILVYIAVPEGGAEELINAMPISAAEKARANNLFTRSRTRYMAVSDRAELHHPPKGSSHNFPFEHPDWLIALARRAWDATRAGAVPNDLTGR